jgi:PEP-CTERM motif
MHTYAVLWPGYGARALVNILWNWQASCSLDRVEVYRPGTQIISIVGGRMKTYRLLTVLALGVFGLLSAAPSRADSFVAVNMSNLVFTSAYQVTENVSIAFNWDVTNSTPVLGTMSVISSGTLGTFVFGSYGSVSGGEGFEWTNLAQDNVGVNTCGYDCNMFPSVGTYNINDLTMICNGLDTCYQLGFNQVHPTGTFTVSEVPISPVPEPSSLVLLIIGLCGIALMFRRRPVANRIR